MRAVLPPAAALLLPAVLLLESASAQTGSPVQINGHETTLDNSVVLKADHKFYIKLVAVKKVTVKSIEMLIRDGIGPVNLPVSLLADNGGKPDTANPLGIGTLAVSTTARWIRADLQGGSVTFVAGDVAWVCLESPSTPTLRAVGTTGKPGQHYFQRGSGRLQGPFNDGLWRVRLRCDESPLDVMDAEVGYASGTFDTFVARGSAEWSMGDQWVDASGRFHMETELLELCLNAETKKGLMQVRAGRRFDAPSLGAIHKILSNYDGDLFAGFSLHGRDFDVYPAFPNLLVGRNIPQWPPTGIDYDPALPLPTPYVDSCTGQPTTIATAGTRFRTTGPATGAPPGAVATCSEITITGPSNNTPGGWVRLQLKIAGGEPDAGTVITDSGSVIVLPSQSAAITAKSITTWMNNQLPNFQGCPIEITASGDKIKIRSTSYRRFELWISGTDIGSEQKIGPGTNNLGQLFENHEQREFQTTGSPAPSSDVTFSGSGCSVGTEPPLLGVAFNSPAIGRAMRIGASLGFRGPATVLAVLGLNAADVPLANGCRLLVTPDITLVPSAPKGGFATLKLQIPNTANLRGLKVHIQFGQVNTGGRLVTSDRTTLVVGGK